jgi:ribosomal protein S27AE
MREIWRVANRRRKSDPEYRARVNEENRRRRQDPKHRYKILANDKLKAAVRLGKIERMPCERCGAMVSHGHHDDYDKPLDVRWLCALCHGREHRRVT